MPLDELDLIDRHFRPLAGEGAFGLRDDAARLDVPPESDLVVTTDMIASSIHFLPGDPPETIAQKALRVNVSDLAAKGARPLAYVIAMGFSDDVDEAWLAGFARGVKADQARFGISLLGGDTISVRAGPVVSVTAFGAAPKGRMVHRFAASPGEALFVSGTIGAAGAGLALLKGAAGPWQALSEAERADLVARYRVPEPRVALAPVLADLASAAMDVSDGLAGDLDKLCAASGCSAVVDAAAVPLPLVLGRVRDAAILARLIGAGDDYEILATVPETRAERFAAAAAAAGCPVTRIGTLTEGVDPPAFLLEGEPLTLTRRSWVHGRPEES